MTEVPKPLDAALDLFVYAPVGLAMTAAEELPKLAAKGRSRVNTQLMMARVVGQFAVARGRQELEKRLSPPTPPPAYTVPEEPVAPVTFDEMTANGSAHDGDHVVSGETVTEPATDATALAAGDGAAPGTEAGGPRAGDLAIPGYDSLSASQVVQRLAGLDQDELAAVGAYEQTHRGRRTILNRIDQLQGQ